MPPTVSIDEMDAEEMNHDWKKTGIRYDLKEEKAKAKEVDLPPVPPADNVPPVELTEEDKKRAALVAEIEKLGGKTPSPNAKIDTLELKLLELKSK